MGNVLSDEKCQQKLCAVEEEFQQIASTDQLQTVSRNNDDEQTFNEQEMPNDEQSKSWTVTSQTGLKINLACATSNDPTEDIRKQQKKQKCMKKNKISHMKTGVKIKDYIDSMLDSPEVRAQLQTNATHQEEGSQSPQASDISSNEFVNTGDYIRKSIDRMLMSSSVSPSPETPADKSNIRQVSMQALIELVLDKDRHQLGKATDLAADQLSLEELQERYGYAKPPAKPVVTTSSNEQVVTATPVQQVAATVSNQQEATTEECTSNTDHHPETTAPNQQEHTDKWTENEQHDLEKLERRKSTNTLGSDSSDALEIDKSSSHMLPMKNSFEMPDLLPVPSVAVEHNVANVYHNVPASESQQQLQWTSRNPQSVQPWVPGHRFPGPNFQGIRYRQDLRVWKRKPYSTPHHQGLKNPSLQLTNRKELYEQSTLQADVSCVPQHHLAKNPTYLGTRPRPAYHQNMPPGYIQQDEPLNLKVVGPLDLSKKTEFTVSTDGALDLSVSSKSSCCSEVEAPHGLLIQSPSEVDVPSQYVIRSPSEVGVPYRHVIRSPYEVEDSLQRVIESPSEVEAPSQHIIRSPSEIKTSSGYAFHAPSEVKALSQHIIRSPSEINTSPGYVYHAPGEVETTPGYVHRDQSVPEAPSSNEMRHVGEVLSRINRTPHGVMKPDFQIRHRFPMQPILQRQKVLVQPQREPLQFQVSPPIYNTKRRKLESPKNGSITQKDKNQVANASQARLSKESTRDNRSATIFNLIGDHDPNDILYLHCSSCTSTYGSIYSFRKHFRNAHGFEPSSENVRLQSISKTKEQFMKTNSYSVDTNRIVDADKETDPRPMMYQCTFCGRQYPLTKEEEYWQHVQKHDRFKDRYICYYCGFEVKESTQLQYHIQIHDVLPHVCLECTTAFNSESMLQAHVCVPRSVRMQTTLGILDHAETESVHTGADSDINITESPKCLSLACSRKNEKVNITDMRTSENPVGKVSPIESDKSKMINSYENEMSEDKSNEISNNKMNKKSEILSVYNKLYNSIDNAFREAETNVSESPDIVGNASKNGNLDKEQEQVKITSDVKNSMYCYELNKDPRAEDENMSKTVLQWKNNTDCEAQDEGVHILCKSKANGVEYVQGDENSHRDQTAAPKLFPMEVDTDSSLGCPSEQSVSEIQILEKKSLRLVKLLDVDIKNEALGSSCQCKAQDGHLGDCKHLKVIIGDVENDFQDGNQSETETVQDSSNDSDSNRSENFNTCTSLTDDISGITNLQNNMQNGSLYNEKKANQMPVVLLDKNIIARNFLKMQQRIAYLSKRRSESPNDIEESSDSAKKMCFS